MMKKKNTRCVKSPKLLSAYMTGRKYIGPVHVSGKKDKEKEKLKRQTNLARYVLKSAVVESLKSGHSDYCYSMKDEKEILEKLSKTNLTFVWERYYNRYDEYDYTVFAPAKYRILKDGQYTPLKRVYYNKREIPRNVECRIVEEGRTIWSKAARE